MSVFITKQVIFSIDHPSRCKCQECRHQRVGHEFSTSVRISTKSTTNFEASGSTELIRSHHNVRVQWLLMQGTNKDASRCSGSVVSDARNKSPEQEGKKESCEKLDRRVFHVINVRLSGSRGTSSVNSLSSGSSRVSNLESCINFQRKPRRTNSSLRCACCIRVFLSQDHPAVPQNDTSVLLFHTQRDSV